MVTQVSGTNTAIRSTVVRANVDEAIKPSDKHGKEELQQQQAVAAAESLSVSISAQAARQSQQAEASKPTENAGAKPADNASPAQAQAAAQNDVKSGNAPPPAPDAAEQVKTDSVSTAKSGNNSTIVLDISYAAADADQNGVVSFSEQHAYELKHPEKRVVQHSETALSRTSSEAVKAYETVSGAGTDA